MNSYDVIVTREGDLWLGECVQEPSAHTWAPSLEMLRREVIDAVILAADLPDDAEVRVRLVAGEGVPEQVKRGIELSDRREALRAAEVQLQAETAALIRELSREGYKSRDIAGAVGLTSGRVSQLV